MRFPSLRSGLFGFALFYLSSSGLCASAPIAITVTAPRPGTKLTPYKDPALEALLRQLPQIPVNQDLFDGSKRVPPPLPPGAAGRGLHGQVVLRVEVARSGDVYEAVVTQSSGSALLDETARTWVRYVWRYPETPQATVHREQVSFEINKQEIAYESQSADIGRRFSSTPRPPYPYIARKMGWQGMVRLSLVPDGKGHVKTAEITGSSGVRFLDLIARAYSESYWRLAGNEVTACSITFKLI